MVTMTSIVYRIDRRIGGSSLVFLDTCQDRCFLRLSEEVAAAGAYASRSAASPTPPGACRAVD